MRLNDRQREVLKHMKMFRDDEGWWFTGPRYEFDGTKYSTYGPYDNKAECDEARRGLAVTLEKMTRDGDLSPDWWDHEQEHQGENDGHDS